MNSIPESATADLDLRSTSALELDRLELAVLTTLTASVDDFGREPRDAREPRDVAEPVAGRPQRAATNQLASNDLDSSQLRLHVERIGDRPAGALLLTSSLARSLRAVDRHLGLATESRIGSTDANLPLSLGVPAIAVGAGGTGGGIHTLGEWYNPDGRDLALRRILLLLLDSCQVCASEPA